MGPTVDHSLSSAANPHDIPTADPSGMNRHGNRGAVKGAVDYMKAWPNAVAMMLIDQGTIIFEGYQGIASESQDLYSMSMSKSMTSLAVGRALCDGLIHDLDDKAATYVPHLKGNNLGKSTIRQLLTMSSGAFVSEKAGKPKFKTLDFRLGMNWALRRGSISISSMLWGKVWRDIDGQNSHQPGKLFAYKAHDTLALGAVIRSITGKSLAAYWEETIWASAGGVGPGHWEADIDGATMAHAGLQLRLRDWGRVTS